jgi:hypothetical protein
MKDYLHRWILDLQGLLDSTSTKVRAANADDNHVFGPSELQKYLRDIVFGIVIVLEFVDEAIRAICDILVNFLDAVLDMLSRLVLGGGLNFVRSGMISIKMSGV